MRRFENRLLLSASDLNTYLGCRHASMLDYRYSILGQPINPTEDDEELALVQRRGLQHEQRHFEQLCASTTGEVVRIEQKDINTGLQSTKDAMRRGASLIFQGVLKDEGGWHGIADFLVRAERPSSLGTWSYEVHDTKLARSLKAKFAIQLGLYADLLADVQGEAPPALCVVLGDGQIEKLKARDIVYYVRHAKRRLEKSIALLKLDGPGDALAGEPCAACSQCRWRERCDDQWETADDLHKVANIRTSQVMRLRESGVGSAAALTALPADARISGLDPEVLKRLRSQATLQSSVRGDPEARRYTLFEPEPGRGLARLPAPDPADLFFDMEGDPLYSDGGLEYLFGIYGGERFQTFWARSAAEEKSTFEAFMDHVAAVMAANPSARIYHYNHYEPTALKRLAMRYGTREFELDTLLREQRFVDLYIVVREAIQISEPRYSLKNVERFYRPARDGEVGTAADSIVAFERWLETGDDTILEGTEAYNCDDCASTRELRDWLISLRLDGLPWAPALEAQDDEITAKRQSQYDDELAIQARLVGEASETDLLFRQLVAHLAAFHRREQKPEWWAMFDRQNRDIENLIEDVDCLGGLVAIGGPVPIKQSLARTYHFPQQDTKLRPGSATDIAALSHVTIDSLDVDARMVTLKKGAKKEPLPDRLSIGPSKPIDNKVLRQALHRFATSVADQDSRFLALEGLLRREAPRFGNRVLGSAVQRAGETALQAAIAACRDLDGGHLFIQGPPGTGKTWTASRMIVDAIQCGKRVAISAHSHRAMVNLLHGVERAAEEQGVTFFGVKKSDPTNHDTHVCGTMITDVFDNDVPKSAQLVAGTAWLFARGEMEQQFDYLFVDEAGQVSLANLVAMGTAGRNIVLIGDQMQLGQPIQGTHPAGSGISALQHLLQGVPVVSPEHGIFLSETHRMHPDLCGWVSEAIYEGRLSAHPSCGTQALILNGEAHPALADFGLRFREVEHNGRLQRSDEEVEEIAAIWHDLMHHCWRDRFGKIRPIKADDILVVTPWNVQVNAVRRALPEGARVGTVDKFQGQEAAVVLVSMATSSADDIPRGISFLFSRERLNVAISRARCLSIVVASPKLLEVPCQTVDELRMVNALCHVHAWSACESNVLRPPDRKMVSYDARPEILMKIAS